jgi:hypothetical protein
MAKTVQITTPSGNDEALKQNTRHDRRRHIIAGLIALGTVIAGGVSWTMSQPATHSAHESYQHTVPVSNVGTESVYFPAQYINQGSTEPTEPIPTF